MKTAREMYQYCEDNKLGTGMGQKWGTKHFTLIEKALMADEYVAVCFMGLHNYVSNTKHDNNFAYAITNKRVIMAQQRTFGTAVQFVSLEHVNDITFSTGPVFGVLTIDTIKEKFNVAVGKPIAANIHQRVQEHLANIVWRSESLRAMEMGNQFIQGLKDGMSTADELRKFKGLLDDGVITEAEYANKKQQLLEYGA